MIIYTRGNLLEAETEALVNPVNTMGVMGKGLALMFKEHYPDNMLEYVYACKNNRVNTGIMFVTETNAIMGPSWIINFPTKEDWRHGSQILWIEEGLKDLKLVISDNSINSISIPPLGCGLGGLKWEPVKGLIEEILGDIPGVEIFVYEPV